MTFLEKFQTLNKEQQKQVEDYIDFLLHQKQQQLPKGTSGKLLIQQFAGSIPVEVVEEMEAAINDPVTGCSRVENE